MWYTNTITSSAWPNPDDCFWWHQFFNIHFRLQLQLQCGQCHGMQCGQCGYETGRQLGPLLQRQRQPGGKWDKNRYRVVGPTQCGPMCQPELHPLTVGLLCICGQARAWGRRSGNIVEQFLPGGWTVLSGDRHRYALPGADKNQYAHRSDSHKHGYRPGDGYHLNPYACSAAEELQLKCCVRLCRR